MVKAMVASAQGGKLAPQEIELPALGDGDVEIDVTHCGICHSDLSMLNNDWGFSQYPLVPGHEAVGRVVDMGRAVTHLKKGDTVGLGWFSHSCMTCPQCMGGDHNLCPTGEMTMVGRPGGWAKKVRCGAEWAIPIPKGVEAKDAGPLFCGGLTVFNPILQFGVKPTDRVGVIGIGGLGHLALQFLNKWGCEVYAFSSSPGKTDEAKGMGAHHVVNSRDPEALRKLTGSMDFIISTVNVSLDWPAYLETLAPKGKLHVVGAVPEPMGIPVFPLLTGQRSVSGSPVGSPTTTSRMLEFCGRHGIKPITEHFPMSKANEALDHLKAGKARYRIVLDMDL